MATFQVPVRGYRSFTLDQIEIRDDNGAGLSISGHAAVFDQLSEDLGGFREKIARGAFRTVLATNPDVRLLLNHNPDFVLARTKNGTLQLSEDPRGLHITAQAADTTYARDLRTLMQRGDVDQMSFAFMVGIDEWDETDDREVTRTIREFKELFDASIVTFPAYPQTDAQMRSIEVAMPHEQEEAEEAEQRERQRERDLDIARARASLAQAGVALEPRAAGGSGSLPIAPRDRSWDASSAEGRVRSWADAGDGPNPKYARAFFWHADGNDGDGDGVPDNFGDYKLGFADVINGRLTAIPRGIFASAAVLQGGRGGVQIGGDEGAVKARVAHYYERMRSQFEDDTIVVPWD